MKEDITAFNCDNENMPFIILMAGISYCDGTYRIERANSDVCVFEYILKGNGTVIVNNEKFRAVEGDIYILPIGSNHLYFSDNTDPWIKIWFNIQGALIEKFMEAYKLNLQYHIKGLDIKDLFFKFLQTVRSPEELAADIFNKAAVIFHEIIIEISSLVNKQIPCMSQEAIKLRDYLDRHIEDRVGIKELSRTIYRSPSQTIRIFKKEMGMTPYDYLLGKRIETAKLLLSNTNLQVKEIAYKLCFADEHYFSNFFKERTGYSPIQYKKMRWE
jgi:AraC-type DNA-binding domain-containing proteins